MTFDEQLLEEYIEKFFKVDPDDGVPRRGLKKIGLENFTTWREILTALYHSEDINEAAKTLYYGTTRRASDNKDAPRKGMEGSLAKKRKSLGMSWTQALGKDNVKSWKNHVQQSVGYNTCIGCGETKPLDDFKKLNEISREGKYKSDVFRNECHDCYAIKQNAAVIKYKSENRHIVSENSARRRAMIRGQWEELCPEDQQRVNDIYAERTRLNDEAGFLKYHVDHIKPLSKGGLHHPDNLQIMLAVDNMKKGAKWEDKEKTKGSHG